MKGRISSPSSGIEDETSYLAPCFLFFFNFFPLKFKMERLVNLSAKFKVPSICGHKLERDPVKEEEYI